MAVIDVQQFVGLAPRVPPRDMGASSAQACGNLLATALEFRPLQDDQALLLDSKFTGAQTLYRLARDGAGAYLQSDAAGWIVSAEQRSYAKGDLNDDATERTYVTFDDGTQHPRVIDAGGQDRLLGVPAPASITVTLNAGDPFTLDDAMTWVSLTLAPAIVQAIKASLLGAHVYQDDGKPVAGADQMYCLFPWLDDERYGVAYAASKRLIDPSIGFWVNGREAWAIALKCLPEWGVIDRDKLVPALQAIEVPQTAEAGGSGSSTSFSAEQAAQLADALLPLLDPNGASIANWRQQMTAIVKDFCAALKAAVSADAAAPSKPPDKPSTQDVFIYPDNNNWSPG